MSDTLRKNFILLIVISLITSPLLLTASHANSGYTSHGFNANPIYATPNYGNPVYANPVYANPVYANPVYANPNYGMPVYGVTYEGTTYEMGNWGLDRIFPDIDQAYPLTQFASDVKHNNKIRIAVLDTGIYMHADLNNVVWTYDATGGNDMSDATGHGTHVAGIISSFGIADIYAIKVMDGLDMIGEWSWLEAGIYAAMNGPDGQSGTDDDADVINMSLGSRGEVPPSYIETAINAAYQKRITLVASAGNDGDGDISTDDLMQYPAAYPAVIAVGAIDNTNTLASFSNTNSYVEVVAPGVDIISTFKDGDHVFWSGTSMAAPHISGIIAYLQYEYGQGDEHKIRAGGFTYMTSYHTRGLLHQRSMDLGASGVDNGYGYGLIQY